MNGKERIEATLRGEKPDFTPIFPKISYANVIAVPNMTVREYMTDPMAMKTAAVSAYHLFGWDGVALHTDIGSEGRAIGSVYEIQDDGPTQLSQYLLNDITHLERVQVPDLYSSPGTSIVLQAVREVNKEIGKEAYIVAWTNAPLNIASQLLRLDHLLIDMIENPKRVHDLLEKCLEISIIYGKALIDSGAMGIAYGHAVASSNVISPKFYQEFALPYEKRLVSALLTYGANCVITHICGNILPIIDMINENGCSVIDFDHMVDIKELLNKTPLVIRGNIDPALLSTGTAKDVYEKTKHIVLMGKTSNRLIVGSGCEIQLNTPIENLHAMVMATRENGGA